VRRAPFISDGSGEYTRTYVNPEDADIPGFSVFSRRDGTIRHFYSGERSGAMADPGQDASIFLYYSDDRHCVAAR
jgi:hypothetical protein